MPTIGHNRLQPNECFRFGGWRGECVACEGPQCQAVSREVVSVTYLIGLVARLGVDLRLLRVFCKTWRGLWFHLGQILFSATVGASTFSSSLQEADVGLYFSNSI